MERRDTFLITSKSPNTRINRNSISEKFETSYLETEDDLGRMLLNNERGTEEFKELILKKQSIINRLSHSKTLEKVVNRGSSPSKL